MRKTLFAMLGIVAMGLWALPAVALPTPGGPALEGPPKVQENPIPLENRTGAIGAMARGENARGTLSGTMIRQSAVTTAWYLYPGACVERALTPSTWAPKSTPVADSLQPTTGFPNSVGYVDGQPNIDGGDNRIAYTRLDLSLADILWHVVDTTTVVAAERPHRSTVTTGVRALWCGKFDPNYSASSDGTGGKRAGYPNLTFQILYVNTGTHGANWSLTFDGTFSSELNYDFTYFITADTADPLQNRRDLMSTVIDTGTGSGATLQATFTGAQLLGKAITVPMVAPNAVLLGDALADPNTVGFSLNNIPATEIGLYIIFTADCLFSTEDGLWRNGNGQIMDNMAAAGVSLYNDEVALGGVDPFSGNIVKGTYGSAGFISCRVPAGVGQLWQLAPGTENVTADLCSPQKAFATDLFFEGGDPTTNNSINKQFNAVLTCAMPVPVGTASILALWNEYLDLPQFSGLAQDAEYRYFKGGNWTNWEDTQADGHVNTGASQAWFFVGDELGGAVQADSVQVRYVIRCIPPFAADRKNCSSTQQNALLYDDFRLQITSGVPAPLISIFTGAVAQSMFVDGTMKGTNCQTIPCWPGNRGSDLGTRASHNISVNDNWNAAIGDSITLAIVTGLRKDGMGVNWKRATSKDKVTAGELPVYTNASYVPSFDMPRMIFRLFDPATKTWSPFDSTELLGLAVVGVDTVMTNSDYVVNWPPQDKLETGALLPAAVPATGWPGSINGVNNYTGLSFLPRGTRMQYYFKGTDIGGGRTYSFTSGSAPASAALASEVEDLPTLPGSSIIAPDIIEFDVLPRVYAAGPALSLLAGKTDADVLDIDGNYTGWNSGYDPMTQALRGLGVRADRYRDTASGTTSHHLGGHELPGKRPDRLSNFFPNYLEYSIVDSLAAWYRIMIQSNHTSTVTPFNEEDAATVEQWFRKDTGSDQGDRCIFLSGDDAVSTMTHGGGVVIDLQISCALQVFGVADGLNAWSGNTTNSFPTIDDRFAAPNANAGLAVAGTLTYPVDGGCPGPNKFDAIVAGADPDVAVTATYPSLQAAAVSRSRELDTPGDKDRSKSLAYGFSIQFIRNPTYGTTNANYTKSGVENRMKVLYKFLTSCRGQRTSAPADIGVCWPCPSPGASLALMQADWNTQSAGFQTSVYGPLYGIQAGALATGVGEEDQSNAAPRINKIYGNFPNPFNPHTAIRFSSAQGGKAQIRIFSVGGRLVRTLNATVVAGPNEVRWNGKSDDGTPLASGVYFYRLISSDGQVVKGPSMVLVK